MTTSDTMKENPSSDTATSEGATPRPRTEAGRGFAGSFVLDGGHYYGGTADALGSVIRAIEDEARSAALRDVEAELTRLRAIEAAARAVMDEWDKLGPTGTQSTIGAHHRLRESLR